MALVVEGRRVSYLELKPVLGVVEPATLQHQPLARLNASEDADDRGEVGTLKRPSIGDSLRRMLESNSIDSTRHSHMDRVL